MVRTKGTGSRQVCKYTFTPTNGNVLPFSIPIPIRNSYIRTNVIVDKSLDNAGNIVYISFCRKDRMLPFLKDDPYMVVLFVLKYPVIEYDVSRFRNKTFRPFMVFNPPIAYGKLLPAKACCQVTGFTFLRSVRDPEPRC